MKKIRPTRIIEGTIKNLTGKKTQSSTDRYNTCKPCDENIKGVCRICFCVVKSKSKVFTEYCPMNKWNDIKLLKKTGISIAIKNPEKATLTIDEKDNSFIFTYGKIKQKSDTTIQLLVVNDRGNHFTEKQDLNNIKVRTTCSCTVPTKPPKNLKEGSSFDFEIKYDAERIGVFSKKVHFVSDETAFIINLKGEVQ